jgi:protoporphyrinogen/coproporphyrinogen III oxidase
VRVLVVGGGPAGCVGAYRLQQLGHDVSLFESEDHVGGRTWTLRDGGFEIDTGAFAITNLCPRVLALADELGEARSVDSFAPTLAVQDGDRLHVVAPASLGSRLRFPAVDWRSKLKLAGVSVLPAHDIYDADGLARADDGETAADWGRRKVGVTGYDYVVRPMIAMVGGSCEVVGAAFAAGLVRDIARMRPLRLDGGMGSLCEWIAGRVADLRTGTEVTGVDVESDGVRLATADGRCYEGDVAMVATDAHVAARLLDGVRGSRALREAEYAPTAHVAIGFESTAWAGFPAEWVVAGADRGAGVIGLLSRRSPAAVPDGAEVLDVYFTPWASRDRSDSELVRGAHAAIRELLGAPVPRPLFELVFRDAHGLAAPRPGRSAELLATRAALPDRVAVVGDYVSFGGVELAVRTGEWGAERLHELAAQ